MWFKVLFIHVLFHLSTADLFTMCMNLKVVWQCNVQDPFISCPYGIANITSFEYVLEESRIPCCAVVNDNCKVPQPVLLSGLRRNCINKPRCHVTTNPTLSQVFQQMDMDCDFDKYDDVIVSQAIVNYSCKEAVKSGDGEGDEAGGGEKDEAGGGEKDEAGGGDEDEAGGGGNTLVVGVAVTSVLGVLVLIIVIVGLLIFKRRAQRKSKGDSNNTAEENRQSEVNPDCDGEYNTIPADYDEIPSNPSNLQNGTSTDTGYCKVAQGDSVRYSTIVLREDLDLTKKSTDSGYDKANVKREFNTVNISKDSQNDLHSYSHTNDTLDDYNVLKTTNNKHGIDKDYSQIESEVSVDDYSHLNGKNKTPEDSNNDYNHLKLNDKSNRPVKRADSYEKPVTTSENDQKGEQSAKQHDDVDLIQPENLTDEINTDLIKSKLKRVDSYEQPIFKGAARVEDDSKNELNSTNTSRDDYETPVNYKQPDKMTCINTDVLTDSKEKWKDNYEKPVLNTVGDKHDISPTLKQTQLPEKLKRVDSYETPVLKTQGVHL